jgi:hypothetical protein
MWSWFDPRSAGGWQFQHGESYPPIRCVAPRLTSSVARWLSKWHVDPLSRLSGMSRSPTSLPSVPMASLSTKVSPEASLAFARAAREAKTSESDYLRKLVLSDPATAKHLGDPASRRRFQR